MFLLIQLSGTCQNGYPKAIKIEGKDFVIMTKSQGEYVNFIKTCYDNIRQDSAIMSTMLGNCNVMLNTKNDEADNDARIIQQFRLNEKDYKNKDVIYDKTIDKLTKSINRNKNILIGETSVIGILAILLILK